MTTDDKYSRRNMQNFTQELEARLSQKQERFSGFFIGFLKCGFNLEHSGKRDECSSLVLSKVIDSETGCYLKV